MRAARPGHEAAALLLDFAAEITLDLWLADPRRTFWEPNVIARKVNPIRSKYGALSKRSDLIGDLCAVGVLSKTGADSSDTPLMYSHRTLGEYLASRALAHRLEDPEKKETWDLLDDRALNPDWQEVLVFAVAHLGSQGAHQYLVSLADEGKDDRFRQRLAMAARCLPELHDRAQDGDQFLERDKSCIAAAAINCWWRHYENSTTSAIFRLSAALPSLAKSNPAYNGRPVVEWLAEPLEWVDRVLNPSCSDYADITLTKDVDMRLTVISWMGACAVTPKVTTLIKKCLISPVGTLRTAALRAISAIPRSAVTNEILDLLCACIDDSRAKPREGPCEYDVINVLRQIGPKASVPGVWQRVLSALVGDDFLTRHFAAKAVLQIGDRAAISEALTMLTFHILNAEPFKQKDIALMLGTMGTLACTPQVLEALQLQSLNSDNSDVKWACSFALSRLGKSSMILDKSILDRRRCDVATLECALRSSDRETRMSAIGEVICLAAIPSGICRALIQMLWSDDELEVWSAATGLALADRYVAEPEVLSRLYELLEHTHSEVRAWAIRVLATVGSAANPSAVFDKINPLLDDEDVEVRQVASDFIAGLLKKGRLPIILGD